MDYGCECGNEVGGYDENYVVMCHNCGKNMKPLKAQAAPVSEVPCSAGVMPYAEYSDEQLKLIARSDSSTLCEYLRTETVFDADRIAACLAIANIAAAEELKRRAKA